MRPGRPGLRNNGTAVSGEIDLGQRGWSRSLVSSTKYGSPLTGHYLGRVLRDSAVPKVLRPKSTVETWVECPVGGSLTDIHEVKVAVHLNRETAHAPRHERTRVALSEDAPGSTTVPTQVGLP
jgi:hypothetical protein